MSLDLAPGEERGPPLLCRGATKIQSGGGGGGGAVKGQLRPLLHPAGGERRRRTRTAKGTQSAGGRSLWTPESPRQRSSGGDSARPGVRTSPRRGGWGQVSGRRGCRVSGSLTFSCARVSFFCTLLAIFPAVTPLLPISAIAAQACPVAGADLPSPQPRPPAARPARAPAPRRALDRRADWRRRSVRPASERHRDRGRDGLAEGGGGRGREEGPGLRRRSAPPARPLRTRHGLLKGHPGAGTARPARRERRPPSPRLRWRAGLPGPSDDTAPGLGRIRQA